MHTRQVAEIGEFVLSRPMAFVQTAQTGVAPCPRLKLFAQESGKRFEGAVRMNPHEDCRQGRRAGRRRLGQHTEPFAWLDIAILVPERAQEADSLAFGKAVEKCLARRGVAFPQPLRRSVLCLIGVVVNNVLHEAVHRLLQSDSHRRLERIVLALEV